jgi:Predicted AAA-ATPase/PD-(D/E)XK nuclease superfamily
MSSLMHEPIVYDPRRLPVGYSDFSDLIRHQLDFVDKTLFIKEVFDNTGTQVSVITRPRRFGKTLNLSMLHYFLASEIRGQATQRLFDGLKIAASDPAYLSHQGKYPVIFVSFKDIKGKDFASAYAILEHLLSALYSEHYYLLSSTQLLEKEKKIFSSIMEKESNPAEIGYSLRDLSHYLHRHFGIKPWILIDEYDTPIQSGYLNGYYEEIVGLIRTMFSAALKDNPSLEKSVITGILRISKESLFSGANNIRVYSILEKEYSEHFGFTEAEVDGLLEKYRLAERSPRIRDWYNGYQIGSTIIYNPWSLINCIQNGGLLKPYWVNTSGNDLVKHLLARGDLRVKTDLEAIIHHESITALVSENMVFGDLEKDRNAMWSLLLFCGYFKPIHIEYKNGLIQCELAVPNQEIMALYHHLIQGWLSEPLGAQYLDFLLSLTEGRVEEFIDRLQQYLIQTLSIFDATGREPEKFYHGFVLGMMVSLSDTHEVKSNHESGYGRYDVMLIPKDIEQLGIVIEFKTVRDEKIDLKSAAAEALQQIEHRAYATELKQRGLQRILKMGLAFRNKEVTMQTQFDV